MSYRLYADEKFPLPVVEALRLLGFDVLTMEEADKVERTMPDEKVLASAKDEGRVLLTLNRKHLVRLHREGSQRAGIVACPFGDKFERRAQQIHEVLTAEPDPTGRLLRINRHAS